MTDKKPRVYQIAKDFNVSSEALIEILKGLGVQARSHMSTLDPSVVDLIRQKFQEEKEAVQAEDARKQEAKAAREREHREPARPATPPPPPAPTHVAEAEPAPPPRPTPAPAPPRPVAPTPPPPPPVQAAEPEPPRAPERPRPAPARTLGTSKPRRARQKVAAVDEKAVRDSVKRTLADLHAGGKGRRYKKSIEPVAATAAVAEEDNRPKVQVTEFATVAELAERLGVTAPQVITKLFSLGRMATQNQRLDKDTIELVALEFDHAVEFETEYGQDRILETEEDKPEDLAPRPPVVTVMGHVDHGKTSLLDYIRKANVVAGEKGGITQHIGAYEVELSEGRRVTFLDTPGHQAFTAMRARGAQVTDIVVLVVAADDRVMPQTLEAVNHARAANVPMIIAINKIDKPEARPAFLKQDLASNNILIEEFGGKIPAVEISAKKGTGVQDLMEVILLQADLMELKGNPKRRASGAIIESKVEQGRGIVATVLVQTGTLKIGDPFVCGSQFGKVRAMFDERGRRVKQAGPSTPVEVTGWSGPPAAGDQIIVAKSEADAREIGQERLQQARLKRQRTQRVTLTGFREQLEAGQVQELKLIIKADVAGSAEVLADQLGRIEHEEVRTQVILSGVGNINESDVNLAAASGAVIIGFNVKPDAGAQAAAEREDVDVRNYGIIYEAVEDVTKALEGLLKPEEVEKIMAQVEVRQVFHISKVGTIAGCYVQSGTVTRQQKARLIRDDEVIYTGPVTSLKRFKDDVKEVAAGFECGIGVGDTRNIREGDRIETFVIEIVARRL